MPNGMHRTYGAHNLHFITCSCYQRLPLLNSPKARDCSLEILEQMRQRYRFVVVGYVVMPSGVSAIFAKNCNAGVRGARPFAKNAKERGTLCVSRVCEIKSLGHPPEGRVPDCQ